MRDLIIVGTSKASALIACVIEREEQARVLAYTTYRSMIKENSLAGKPVVAIEDLNELYDMKNTYILNTIGYTEMNTVREMLGGRICIQPECIFRLWDFLFKRKQA